MSGHFSPRFDSALGFAARCHGGQKRKGSDIPYIVHPFHVAVLLRSYAYGEDVQIAGLLHDVLEDTDCTYEMLEEHFGTEVADNVRHCTEPDHSLPWETRKARLIEQMRLAPSGAKAVGCADKAHNLWTLVVALEHGRSDLWSHFSRGPDAQLGYYRRMSEALRTGFDEPIHGELARALLRFEHLLDVGA